VLQQLAELEELARSQRFGREVLRVLELPEERNELRAARGGHREPIQACR
jgi:hypothetical protein